MLSAPGALLALDLLRALSSEKKEMGGSLDLRFDLMSASWVELLVSNLEKKELRSVGRDAGVLPGMFTGLLLVGRFIAAILLRSCQAEWRFP